MDLYSKTSYRISEAVTSNYSTSFRMGIAAFAPRFRDPIFALYGFVRIADEIVDTFHKHDKKRLLDDYRRDTYRALEQRISTNPVLHSFQNIVHKYKIDREYIDAFLDSMEMDITNNHYDEQSYKIYVYGSAEVVGLMCLKVFVEGDGKKFDELKAGARALGSAFQKVNFLRDIKADLETRGRIYLPGIGERELVNNENKKKLEAEIEEEFRVALQGIKKLPKDVRFGVYTAYQYFYKLFDKIKKSDIETIFEKRLRIPNFIKFSLLLQSLVKSKFS